MKTPICEHCVKSGDLCPICKEKFDQGDITHMDIGLARLLQKMEKKNNLKDPSFEKTIVVDDLLLVMTKDRVGNLVGKGGRIVRLLSRELGKTVRVINDKDFKTSVQDLVYPARVLGINIVYKQEGEQTKVVVAKQDKNKLVAHIEVLQKAARVLAGNQDIILELE